jgi:hypothetical protein
MAFTYYLPVPPGLDCEAGARPTARPASPVVDASSVPEAGVGLCGSGPANACNQLANTGRVVTALCVAGDPPAMTGGTFAPGTYVLSLGELARGGRSTRSPAGRWGPRTPF